MDNIENLQTLLSALIGVGSAIIVTVLSGIIQLSIARKSRKLAETQFEASRREFSEKMKQAQIENAERIAQLQEEQKKSRVENASRLLQAETNRFYDALKNEMAFYERLLNELHYLNNITSPRNKDQRLSCSYPYIDNNIQELVGDISLHQDIAKLLGALRANISMYNTALKQGKTPDVLEESIDRIHVLISPINDERFKNYADAQSALRKHEAEKAKQTLYE